MNGLPPGERLSVPVIQDQGAGGHPDKDTGRAHPVDEARSATIPASQKGWSSLTS